MLDETATPDEKSAAAGVRKAMHDGEFADYYFVGVRIDGKRLSGFSIGNDGSEFSFSNCERWDRLVGAMQRQIMQWEIEKPDGSDLDVDA